jgi:nitrogen regulatory protein PII
MEEGGMQMIWAIIRTDALPRVREALRNLGIRGYTVVEVEGMGEEQAFFSILSGGVDQSSEGGNPRQ